MHQKPIPTLKISPNRITFFQSYEQPRTRTRAKYEMFIERDSDSGEVKTTNSNRKHQGTLSENGRRNLVKACERFVYFLNLANQSKRARKIKTKRSLKFITLTLASAQVHSDTEIRKMLLNQFLTELREKHNLTNYVWKAEKQKNGNLHFHILIDIYIDHRKIREYWNRIQEKLGYVTRFKFEIEKKGYEYYYDNQKKNNKYITGDDIRRRWQKGKENNWSNPSGTEIKQVERVNNASAYFAKYFSKEDYIEEGFGRIWFASRSVTQFPTMYVQPCKGFHELENYLFDKFKSRAYICEYAISWKFDLISLNALFPTVFLGEYIARCLEWSENFW